MFVEYLFNVEIELFQQTEIDFLISRPFSLTIFTFVWPALLWRSVAEVHLDPGESESDGGEEESAAHQQCQQQTRHQQNEEEAGGSYGRPTRSLVILQLKPPPSAH